MRSRWRSLMTSQGMGSRKGKDLWKDSACSSFLEQGRERGGQRWGRKAGARALVESKAGIEKRGGGQD